VEEVQKTSATFFTSATLIRVVLNGQIRVRRGWGGGGAWCGGGVAEAQRTQGTRQLEV
jgi:hypothetical protein